MSGPIILSIAVLIYAVVHSLLASLGVKSWVHRQFGLVAARWYRLVYNLFAVISGLPILFLLFLLPDHLLYQIPIPWIFISAVGQLSGVLIIVVGILQTDLWYFIGLRQILKPVPNSGSPLITTGLYRWMRHPLYTGGLLLIWLVPTMTVNLLTVFIWFTIYLVLGAKLEEKRLVREFGDEYLTYQRDVPMLIPIPWHSK